MKSFISVGVMALFASSVMARYCNDHVYYCGWNLSENIGEYDVEIENALREVGISNPTDHQKKQSLFYCRDHSSDGVGFERTCDECNDGGSGQSDYCDNVGP